MPDLEIKYSKKKIDIKLDDKIREFFESVGYKWYAQGYDHQEKVRDICFDYIKEV